MRFLVTILMSLISVNIGTGQVREVDASTDLVRALERVSEQFGVRIGLEYRMLASARPLRFPTEVKTARAAIARIVQQIPEYRWAYRNGVAHVYDPAPATSATG